MTVDRDVYDEVLDELHRLRAQVTGVRAVVNATEPEFVAEPFVDVEQLSGVVVSDYLADLMRCAREVRDRAPDARLIWVFNTGNLAIHDDAAGVTIGHIDLMVGEVHWHDDQEQP